MLKIAIGLFAGMMLISALFTGPLSLVPVTGQSEDPSPEETLPDIAEIYQKALIPSLPEAGEIQYEEIAQFYHRFLKNVGWTIESN